MRKKNIIAKILVLASTVFFFSSALTSSVDSFESLALTTYQNGDADTYYDSIDSSQSGETLLSSLRTLNLSKRKNPINYGNLNSYFKYTDYDPTGVQYDSNNQPYNTKLLSFYSGTSTTSYNKEHVWPNSRGGGSDKGKSGAPYVENDIHMPRPTITAENSNRGNSSFVEGMAHTSQGWDPVTAFGADNCYQGENVRGECARIIFYCLTVNANLKLADDADSDNSTRVTIGKLSDMLKWNLKYPVNEREERRNEGAEYLQGNRNAFIDHPEYACKIWGNATSATQKVCSEYAPAELESLSINKTTANLVYGETVQLSITPNPSNASSGVTWSSSNTGVATVSSSGLVTALNKTGSATITATSTSDTSISVSCVVTVSEPSNIDITSINASNVSLQVDSTYGIEVSYSPSNAYPTPTYTFESSDTNIATVDNDGSVTGISAGKTTITIKAYQDGTLKATTSCAVTVTEKPVVGDSATIEFLSNSDDSGTRVTSETFSNQISNGSKYVSSATTLTNIFPGKSGLKLGSKNESGQLVFTVSSLISSYKVQSITMNSVKYGTDTCTLTLSVNGSSVLSNISPDSAGTESAYSPSSSITVNSIGIATSTKRAYLKSITFNFEASSSYSSDDFAEEFFNSINCDVTGVNRPSFNNGKSWSDFKTSYNKLSTTEKNKLINATYSVSGSGASTVVTPNSDTTQIVANAMYRYDYIITKYNTSTYKTYEEFISGRVSLALVTPINYNAFTTQSTLIIAISIFAIGITSLTIIYVVRKRQERN